MKKLRISLSYFLIVLLMGCSQQQQGSILISENANLATLCKLWGYLKYYHPEVGAGNKNWDSTLLIYIDKTRNIKDQDSLKLLFDELVPPYNGSRFDTIIYDSSDLVTLNLNVNFIYDTSVFFPQTSEKLIQLLGAEPFENKYIYNPYKTVSNPYFDTDTLYNSIPHPDENIRLLSLFRYWNMINYYFPYKYMADNDWGRVLELFIPRMINTSDSVDYHLAVCELTAMINDNHGYTTSPVISSFWGKYRLPVRLDLVEDKTVVLYTYSDSLAELNDLQQGDVILEINDLAVDKIRDSLVKYFSASNKSEVQHLLGFYIRRSADSIMKLKIQRNDSVFNVLSALYSRDIISKHWQRKRPNEISRDYPDRIKYLNLSNPGYDNIDSIMLSSLDSKVLILDLRRNCKFIVHDMCRLLFENRKEFYIALCPNYLKPGLFYWKTGDSTGPQEPNPDHYRGKIIVLANNDTQSIGEFTTMALMAFPRTTVLGSPTAGADGNVSFIYLPGKITTHISGIGIYWPDKSPTQRIGIIPDIEVYPTINGIKQGLDEELECALEYARSLVK